MDDINKEIQETLTEIKSSVDAKLETTVLKSDFETLSLKIEVDSTELKSFKTELEALEAKLNALPAQTNIKKEDPKMNIHEIFEKNFAETGKAETEVFLKAINQTTNVTGAPTDTLGLEGSLFASNPFRALAKNLETNSKAITIPVRTGAHGAAKSAAVRNLTDAGTAAVTEVTVMVETIDALSNVAIETSDDIIGFDAYWAQDMLDEIASVEAQSHVTIVEAISGVTAAHATNLALADFASLMFSVAPQYRANGAFVVSTGAMAQLRTLSQSSTGGDLVFDAQIGTFRLFGAPVYESAYMAAPASTKVVAAYGDFQKGLIIANRGSATVGRYVETKPGHYSYYASLRSGMKQLHTDALKTLKMKT
ncbi:phage major capsid protein (plasmid) [Pseudorhodobacter turbinis]|uniref:Phage major capsid protein n=1 Tax=Pseudorhodobacter turbinis TaxID=2500533 RepID=A0A4P8EK86_9RHOB|nr:phage major capsid protein [Pseudorhodobacter turbinis]QCO57457.1 phage major capsid protein [Pseudorhodobacter turbinis]